MDRVRNGRGRRNDVGLAHAARAEWMTRVWNLHNDGVYHRQVQARRHAVIEEAGVHHRPVGAHRILFVQRPADSLDAPSLHLALDVARVNCLACILDGCEPKNGYLARVRVTSTSAMLPAKEPPTPRA